MTPYAALSQQSEEPAHGEVIGRAVDETGHEPYCPAGFMRPEGPCQCAALSQQSEKSTP